MVPRPQLLICRADFTRCGHQRCDKQGRVSCFLSRTKQGRARAGTADAQRADAPAKLSWLVPWTLWGSDSGAAAAAAPVALPTVFPPAQAASANNSSRSAMVRDSVVILSLTRPAPATPQRTTSGCSYGSPRAPVWHRCRSPSGRASAERSSSTPRPGPPRRAQRIRRSLAKRSPALPTPSLGGGTSPIDARRPPLAKSESVPLSAMSLPGATHSHSHRWLDCPHA